MRLAAVVTAVVVSVAGCGRPGMPVAPEDYGIGPLLQQRQQAEESRRERGGGGEGSRQSTASQEPVPLSDELALPDLRPVGTR
jgi:hypothetical protein